MHDTPLFSNPCNCPDSAPGCIGKETCDEIYPAECVEYRGPELTNINVLPKDRLNIILQKLDINHFSNSINVADTNTVDLEGNGLLTSRLRANVKLDPDASNLILATTEGLLTKFTQQNVLQLLSFISNNETLRLAFCGMVAGCAPESCNISSGLTVTVDVASPITISAQPQSASKFTGENVTFSVTATSSTSLTYQWRKNGNNISGATGTTYSLSNLNVNDAGIYDVRITNNTTTVTSSSATLAVAVQQVTFTAHWTWSATDPTSAIQGGNAPSPQGSATLNTGANIIADFSAMPEEQYPVVDEPSTEPVKTHWLNTPVFNEGTIGVDSIKLITANGRHYYIGMAPMSFDSSAPVTFS